MRTVQFLALSVAAAFLVVIFGGALLTMTEWWARPEYNHGYAIPFISLFLIWRRADDLRAIDLQPSWLGVPVVFAGLLMALAGELSALYVIVHYAFLVTLWGLVITGIGPRGFRVISAGMFYLLFMVPLPQFLQWTFTSELQMISSRFGAMMLELMGISVYVEGNIIDIGSYQLQVVEACSGLRYLVPLLSLGVFFALLYRGSFWEKAFVTLSTIPITIAMNSFRIAINGVLVERFGVGVGEGFLHFFEGWVIFMACIALLLAEIRVIAALSGRSPGEMFDLNLPPFADLLAIGRLWRIQPPVVVACLMLCAAGLISWSAAGSREQIIPPHPALAGFPMSIDEWRGTPEQLSKPELDQLQLTDYLLATYRGRVGAQSLELYVAYYDSQRKGASAHSPRSCIPSAGWVISRFEQAEIPDVLPDGTSLPVNRAVITKGRQEILVYYWFMQRGRNLTNEYLVKWFIFWDALILGRTDGALVRVMTPIDDVAGAEGADARLRRFIGNVQPRLDYHIPQRSLIDTPDGTVLNTR